MQKFEGTPKAGAPYVVVVTETVEYRVPVTAEEGDDLDGLVEQAHHLISERAHQVTERITGNVAVIHTAD